MRSTFQGGAADCPQGGNRGAERRVKWGAVTGIHPGSIQGGLEKLLLGGNLAEKCQGARCRVRGETALGKAGNRRGLPSSITGNLRVWAARDSGVCDTGPQVDAK